MKIKVDFDLCESNALCEALAPDVFELDDDEAGSLKATGYASMGMMVDTIYRGDDWIDDTFMS